MGSDLAIQAQLVLPEQRQLFDHWRRHRRDGFLPRREDFRAEDLRGLLPGLSIIDIEEPVEQSTFRLAGTGLREIFGREITGVTIESTWSRDRAAYWSLAYERAVTLALPVQGAIKAAYAGRDHLVTFWLRLPLSDDGSQVNRLIGYDAAFPCHAGDAGMGVSDRVLVNCRG